MAGGLRFLLERPRVHRESKSGLKTAAQTRDINAWAHQQNKDLAARQEEGRVKKGTMQETADIILDRGGVASVPGSAFYADGGGENLVRFTFAKTDEVLQQACRRLGAEFG